MALIRPRLTDHHGTSLAQAELDFAVPFFKEDIPLYVDPFLLWRSPSQQDQALHTSLVNSFNHLNRLRRKGDSDRAVRTLIAASECDEVGLGVSASRQGKRIGERTATEILSLFERIPTYGEDGFTHFEEIQLYVDGIARDRISDFCCNFLKSFLIDYTVENCLLLNIPIAKVRLRQLYDYRTNAFQEDVEVELPVTPETGEPIILTPKRWLRHVPWINFDDYFKTACPKDDVINEQGADDRVKVLLFNRAHHDRVADYVALKERTAGDAKHDPLFSQIPVLSAKRKFQELKKIQTGITDKADKRYEDSASQLLQNLLYPHLDFADTQVRTDSGSTIKDLIFYNNRSVDFLQEILTDYNSRQVVFELKNVKEIARDHIYQLNRYLTNEFGGFGILVTRNPMSKAMHKNTVDLWSGQRRCIISITDEDIDLMIQVYESKQRQPIEIIKKKYIEFRRTCPS